MYTTYKQTQHTLNKKPLEETPEEVFSYKRTPKKENSIPEKLEVKLWPTGKRRNKPEGIQEEITLKPITKPQSDVEEKPEEEIEGPEFLPEIIEELPEKIQIVETKRADGTTKKQVIKKRVIRKKRGNKQEITEIITKEEKNAAPITSVSVSESTVDETIESVQPFNKIFDKALVVEEIPEDIEITEVKTREGPKKSVTKKRVIKKKSGRKESVTEIITKQIEGYEPITTVEVTEVDLPFEEVTEELKPIEQEEVLETIEELPEHIQVIETRTDQGKFEKTIVKKRTIKKKKGKKEEITEVLTKQEEGKVPETLVTFSEVHESEIVPAETVDEFKSIVEKSDKATPRKTISCEEAHEFKPEIADLLVEFMKKSIASQDQKPEADIIENVVEEGKPTKKITKRRVAKKKLTPEEENIKRLLELEVSKTPLEDYEKVYFL